MTGVAIVLGLSVIGPQLRNLTHALRIARRVSLLFCRSTGSTLEKSMTSTGRLPISK
jgi:hypothetical protein